MTPPFEARVRVGGIVLAKIGAIGHATECKVEKLTIVGTGRSRPDADLFLVQQLYKVTLRPSGRRIADLDDYTVHPWEPGSTHSVELPGSVIERVL